MSLYGRRPPLWLRDAWPEVLSVRGQHESHSSSRLSRYRAQLRQEALPSHGHRHVGFRGLFEGTDRHQHIHGARLTHRGQMELSHTLKVPRVRHHALIGRRTEGTAGCNTMLSTAAIDRLIVRVRDAVLSEILNLMEESH